MNKQFVFKVRFEVPMSLSRTLAIGVLLCLSALVGCASPPAIYGERARFSPAFRGYVMASNNGSDDPGTLAPAPHREGEAGASIQ